MVRIKQPTIREFEEKQWLMLALLNPELVLIMRQLGRVVVDANYRLKVGT
jgi:hypothetical protein